MHLSEEEKLKLGSETLISFFEQFGDDIYSKILIEELLEELYKNGK